MRNLYFKIFLWFWLAMALVGIAFVVSTVTLQNSEANARWESYVTSVLTVVGQSSIDAYRERGGDGLGEYLGRMERQRRNIRAYLYDDNLQELSGRQAPPGGDALVRDAMSTDELAFVDLDQSRLVALRMVSAGDEAFVVLADLEWPARGGGGRSAGRRGRDAEDQPGEENTSDRAPGSGRGGRGDGVPGRTGEFRGDNPRNPSPWFGVWLSAIEQPGALALRMGAILITAGLLCYGLARYLTAPVLRLRDATRDLAAGDLSVRVGPAVGNRRDELAELGRDFDLMAERIESLLTTQRQLLGDISHELRSPLARLNVALALARQRSGEDATAPLDRIESEAEQLNSLIGRVLTLARFESGAVSAEFADVDLHRLVEDIVDDAGFEAEPRGVSVSLDAAAPCRVRGDEPLLRSAIENVVRNAVRYTETGTKVEISLRRDEGQDSTPPRVQIVVRDHGPGVAEDQLQNLFEPFYRIADSRDRQSGGTGLGLSITDRAVRLHGGSASASNASDGGLVVTIELPVDATAN